MTLRALILAAGMLVMLASGCGRLTQAPTTTATTGPAPIGSLPSRAGNIGGSSNILQDGSFEKGIGGWAPWGANSKVLRTHQFHLFGRSSLLAAAKTPAPFGVNLIGAIGYPGVGDRYTLTLWVRTATHPIDMIFILQGSNYAKTELHPEVVAQKSLVISTAWKQVKLSGTIQRVGRTSLDIFIEAVASIGQHDGFYVDAAVLHGGPR